MDADASKVDSAYSKLKDLVTQFDLEIDRNLRVMPGEHLHIIELSDRLKTSATPVRQALERLRGEGLIDIIPKRGFFARFPDASEQQDLYEFALLVVGNNIKRPIDQSAISGFGPGPIEVEQTDVGSATKCIKHQAMIIENTFERIARSSRNRQMHRMIRNFNDRSRYVRCLSLTLSSDPQARVRENLAILELLRNGEIDGAGASLERQMMREINELPQLLRHAQSRWAESATAAV
jgi:DNA-binding GntR family transcriptional regulator